MDERDEDPTDISPPQTADDAGDIAPPGVDDDATPDAAPPDDSTHDAPAERGRGTILLAVGAVVVAAAIGVGGYLIGHSAADAGGAYDRGVAAGQGEIRAEYAEGTPRYKAIYDDGFSAGERRGRAVGLVLGRKLGKRQGEVVGDKIGLDDGRKQGEVSGTRAGAGEALGNFSDWQAGSLYVVKVSANDQPEVPIVISQRRQMESDLLYELCQDNPENLCTRLPPLTAGG